MSSFGSVPSPVRPKGSRRRSASASGGPRTSDLEAEIASLRLEVDSKSVDLAAVQTQMGSVKRDKMKLENEKLAAERAAKKEIEDLKSRLDDATYELDDWRQSSDGDPKAEVNKVKKLAAEEAQAAKQKVEKLADALEERSRTVGGLQSKLVQLEDRNTMLEAAAQIQHVGPAPDSTLKGKRFRADTGTIRKDRNSRDGTCHGAFRDAFARLNG